VSDLLFVYGTLRSDVAGSRFALMAADATRVGRARVRGRLFDLGHYPGLVAAPDGDAWVGGEVHRLREPEATLARLDEYEGCAAGTPGPHEFERSVEEIVLDAGDTVRAWVYHYRGPTAGYPEVLGRSPRWWTPPGATSS